MTHEISRTVAPGSLGASDAPIALTSVVKVFGRRHAQVRALDNVSFQVAAGETFGLIGPNGS
ncbi:MAG: hypothetical protein ACXVDA_05320, partial [Ktedonobacterales bacterium]